MRLSPAGDWILQQSPLVPNCLYKTELCRSWLSGGTCRYGSKCQFAHGPQELRPVVRHPKYKTEVPSQQIQHNPTIYPYSTSLPLYIWRVFVYM